MHFYVKIKGQADADMQKKSINKISILKFSLVQDIKWAKFIEK